MVDGAGAVGAGTNKGDLGPAVEVDRVVEVEVDGVAVTEIVEDLTIIATRSAFAAIILLTGTDGAKLHKLRHLLDLELLANVIGELGDVVSHEHARSDMNHDIRAVGGLERDGAVLLERSRNLSKGLLQYNVLGCNMLGDGAREDHRRKGKDWRKNYSHRGTREVRRCLWS